MIKTNNILLTTIIRSVPPFRTSLCMWTHCWDKKAIEPIASDIKVYPNPSKGQVNIKLPTISNGTWQIKVLDMLGNLITEKSSVSGTSALGLNLNVKPGIYSVQMINNLTGKQSVQKIEIQ